MSLPSSSFMSATTLLVSSSFISPFGRGLHSLASELNLRIFGTHRSR